jgi:hypothetical protein
MTAKVFQLINACLTPTNASTETKTEDEYKSGYEHKSGYGY